MAPQNTPAQPVAVTKNKNKRKRKSPAASTNPASGTKSKRQAKGASISPPYKNESPFQSDVILVDSSGDDDEDNVVHVESDPEDVGEANAEEKQEPPRKRQKTVESGNEVAQNNDFIGFGSSSEEENDSDEEKEAKPTKKGKSSPHTNVQGDDSSAFPWVKGQNHSTQKEIADWLTLEIKDFVNYISPSKEEIVVRNTVISSLKSHIASFWPETQAHVFGSCATDLYLPGSDIDMVVVSTTGDYEQRSRLYQLSSYLRTHKLAKNIEVIASAKVPIIKFVDPKYNIHVDVSFERTNGIDAARRIRRWLDTNPGLRELVLIVKQFLRSRMLNNVHVGGLGGYATIIMVYHFLKLHPRIASGNLAAKENLGTLLIEFFELYGRNFSYDNLIIAIDPKDDSPKYLRKYRYPMLSTGRSPFTIVIQDPSDPDNNITRSSYNLRDLKKAFGGAYQLLTAKCYELNSASYKNRIGQSILGDIITYKGKSRDFNDDRDKVVNSALINHESSDDESDGAEGNDKYYFSDMTAESDGDTFISVDDTTKPAQSNKVSTSKKDYKNEKISNGSKDSNISKDSNVSKNSNVSKDSNGARPIAPNGSVKNTLDSSAISGTRHNQSAADFMSLNDDSEDDEDAKEKPKANLEKDIKREYWKSKGLEVE